ncbi:unknown [Ruminococcus sp. CAG:382]|nr:unknown [Ruminococcus sp. CAG:382]
MLFGVPEHPEIGVTDDAAAVGGKLRKPDILM